MFKLENLKKFASNHPTLTLVGVGIYGIILGACIVRDLYHYNIIKK